MVNICELLQRRYSFKLKVADKLAPKGKWSGMKAIRTFIADEAPPAYGENLICSGIYAEHGNPVSLHLSMETKPQGEAIAVRAKESGKSECHPVMGGIGVARFSDRNIIPPEKVADVQVVLNDEKLTTPV